MLKALFHCLPASTVAIKFDAIWISNLCVLPVLSLKKLLRSSVYTEVFWNFSFLFVCYWANWIDVTFSSLLFISVLHAGQFNQIYAPIILLDFKFLFSFVILQKLLFSELSFFTAYYCLIECNISYLWEYEWFFFLKCLLPILFFPVVFCLHWFVFLKCLEIPDWSFIYDSEVLKQTNKPDAVCTWTGLVKLCVSV